MYESDCDNIKFQLVSNTIIGWNGLKVLMVMDPYNSLEADINKYLVGYRGECILVIDDRREYHYENEVNVFGISQKI